MPVINHYEPPKRKKLSKAERQDVYDKCGGHCAYCGCDIKLSEMQVDHVIPLANGLGSDTLSNMLPACRSCNHYKSSTPLERFRAEIERFPQVLMRDSVTYKNAVRFGLVEPKPHKVEFYFEKLGIKIESRRIYLKCTNNYGDIRYRYFDTNSEQVDWEKVKLMYGGVIEEVSKEEYEAHKEKL